MGSTAFLAQFAVVPRFEVAAWNQQTPAKWPNNIATGRQSRAYMQVVSSKPSQIQRDIAQEDVCYAATRYPPLDVAYSGIEMLHQEPPVLIIKGFLTEDECETLIACGRSDCLERAKYQNQVVLDYAKLRPLAAVPLLAALPPAYHAVQDGLSAIEVLVRAGGVAALWALGITALVKIAPDVMQRTIGGQLFTGQKWRLDVNSSRPPPPAAWKVTLRFLEQLERLLYIDRGMLETPLLTRYGVGEQQRVHVDARTQEDIDLDTFREVGGQRLVQCLLYLNTMDAAQGGGTKFHDPVLRGLTTVPRAGDLLVFFPTFRDGTMDPRMTHSGEPVVDGEKWILNTWANEFALPGRNRP